MLGYFVNRCRPYARSVVIHILLFKNDLALVSLLSSPMFISFYSLRPNHQFSDISRRVFNARTYIVFSGPVLLCFSRVVLVLLFEET